jgi:hypothetical protein
MATKNTTNHKEHKGNTLTSSPRPSKLNPHPALGCLRNDARHCEKYSDARHCEERSDEAILLAFILENGHEEHNEPQKTQGQYFNFFTASFKIKSSPGAWLLEE